MDDADAALALALQLEEEELARQEQQAIAAQSRVDEVSQNLAYGLTLAAKHLSPTSLAAARAVTPIDRLRREAKEAVAQAKKEEEEKEENDDDRGGDEKETKKTREKLTETRALLDELLSWFKHEFFEWMDCPKCDKCDLLDTACENISSSASSASSDSRREANTRERYKEKKDRSEKRCIGATPPTALERSLDCGRVELWSCLACGDGSLRFPRHNDVPTLLLETRGGRCGEFANAFTAVCNGAGLTARLALDFSDHVWTEVFDPEQRRWIHADSCEAIADEPLLYEVGWGKEPARAVLAFSAHAGDPRVADVTLRYTRLRGSGLEGNRRGRDGRGFTGEALRAAVEGAGVVPLGGGQGGGASAAAAAAEAAERRTADEEELAGDQRALPKEGDEEKAASLPARTAGDAAWIRARGEDGDKGEGKRAPPPLRSFAAPVAAAPSAAAPSASAKEQKGEEIDFAAKIRREFERLRVQEPELAPNEAAVRALQRVTEGAAKAK